MKNIVNSLVFTVLILAFGCEGYTPVEPDLDNTYPSYVELASTTPITVPEGGNISLTLISRTILYDAYTVSYEIAGDYTASGTIDVPGGVKSHSVSIPVDAGIVDSGSLSSTLTFTSVTGDMALGRNGSNTSVDITITKFVPFVASDYAITFDCDEPGYMVYPCTFIETEDPHVLTNTNFWDWGWYVDYTFSGDFDQLITIEEQVVSGLTISGSGTYDGVTRTMVVDYLIVDADGNVQDDNTHTFTVPSK